MLGLGVAVLGLGLGAGGCKSKSEKKQSTVKKATDVPVHPQAEKVKIARKGKKSFRASMFVPFPARRAAIYFRRWLQRRRWTVTTQGFGRKGAHIVATRGRDRLTVKLVSAAGGVDVTVHKGLAQEKQPQKVRPAPLPADLALPDTIEWDSRLYAAAGDFMELRGKCKCLPSKALDRLQAKLGQSGWKLEKKNRSTLIGAKSNRRIKAEVYKMDGGQAGVRFYFSAAEIDAGRPRRTPSATPPTTKTTADKGLAQARDGGEKSPRPTREQLPGIVRKSAITLARKELGVKMPAGFKSRSAHCAAKGGCEMQFVIPSTRRAELTAQLEKALKKAGWKRVSIRGAAGRGGPVGGMLLFSKGKQSVSARFLRTGSGTLLQLFKN
jgi:hypothetical protein